MDYIMDKNLFDRFFGALFGGISYLVPSLICNFCEVIYRFCRGYKELWQSNSSIIAWAWVCLGIIVFPVSLCLELLYIPFNLIFKFLQGTVHGFKDGITSNVQKLRSQKWLDMMFDSDSLWKCNKASTTITKQNSQIQVGTNTFVDTAETNKKIEPQNIIKNDQSNISGQMFFENNKQSNIGNNKDEPIIPTDFVVRYNFFE